MYKIAGQHSFNYPPSFLSRYLKRLVRSLVFTLNSRNSVLETKFLFSQFSLDADVTDVVVVVVVVAVVVRGGGGGGGLQ